MARRGDVFGGDQARRSSVVIDPGAIKWTDQVVYFFRSITGQDVPDTFRAVIWTFNDAIGRLSDVTANIATLITTPKTEFSLIALTKAIAVIVAGLKAVLDAIALKIDAANAKLDDAHLTLDEIATQSAAIAVDTGDILIELRRVATPFWQEGTGLQTLNVTGRLAWLSWDMPAAAAPRVEVEVGGAIVQGALSAAGNFYFDPPLPIGAYSIRVNPGGVTPAMVNAGAIV